MVKRVLVLGTTVTSKSPEEYYKVYTSLFEDAAGLADVAVEVATALTDDLCISVGVEAFRIYDTKNAKDIADYEVIFLRGGGFRGMFDVLYTVSTYCKAHNVRLINSYTQSYDFSKLAQAVRLLKGDVPVPQTVYVTPAVVRGACQLPFAFPCIMKDVYGAHGLKNFVVESFEDVLKHVEEHQETKFILQAFVPNDGDIRVVILGNDQLVLHRKAAGGSHLNNTSQGGSADLLDKAELDARLLPLAKRAAKVLDMTCAGVDIIIHQQTDEYYVLEVNSQPQIISGAFLQDKKQLLAQFLKTL